MFDYDVTQPADMWEFYCNNFCPDLEYIVLISTEYNNYSGEVTQGGLIPRVIFLKGDMRVNET